MSSRFAGIPGIPAKVLTQPPSPSGPPQPPTKAEPSYGMLPTTPVYLIDDIWVDVSTDPEVETWVVKKAILEISAADRSRLSKRWYGFANPVKS